MGFDEMVNRCEKSKNSNIDNQNSKKWRGFKIVVSDNKAYKQFGNAVVPQVVEWVGREAGKFV